MQHSSLLPSELQTSAMEDTFETRSVCSSTSRTSQRSSASAIAARARAKAEAARAQASFAQKEADVIKAQAYIEEEQQKAAAEATRKKAELEVSLHTLRLESAAAAAIAEANVLEAAAENEFGELDRASLKSEYANHSKCVENPKLREPMPIAMRSSTMVAGESAVKDERESKGDAIQDLSDIDHRLQGNPHNLTPSKDSPMRQMQQHNPRSFINYQPPQPYSAAFPRTDEPNSSSTTDLAKYLKRREMISSGLLRFDDCPEHYWAWKAIFLRFYGGFKHDG